MRVLFIKFSAIGDIVEATPALRALKKDLGCHITLLTVKDYEGLLADCPYVDEIIAMERPFTRLRSGWSLEDTRKLLHFLRALNGRRFDAIVNYQQNARSFVVELFIQRSLMGKIRALKNLIIEALMPVWCKKLRQRRLFTAIAAGVIPFRPGLYYDPYPERQLGISRLEYRPEFFLNDELRAYAESVLHQWGIRPSQENPLIGINPGVNWESKRYFEERYAEVANALIDQMGAWIILFGGPDDVAKAEAVIAGVQRRDRIFSLAGKTPTPNHAAAVIARCRLFITNDTGLMHIAGALGIPTVSIFGGTHPALHAPRSGFGVPHLHLSAGKHLPCWPCYRYYCLWKNNRECFRGITVDRVLEAAVTLLRGQRGEESEGTEHEIRRG